MTPEAEAFDRAAGMIGTELSDILMRISDSKKAQISEIRLRADKAVALTSGADTVFVSRDGTILYAPTEKAVCCSGQMITESVRSICGYSVYSRQNELSNGFITAQNGCRIGICGTAAVRNNTIAAVSHVTSLNIRVAREIRGSADELIRRLFPRTGGILVAGPPSCGKTTLLRDLARQLSLGSQTKRLRTCLIDERGEFSGGGSGILDTGLSDVSVGYPKSEGIMQAVRSLSPQVIICDEIGTEEDAAAVAKGTNAGIMIIASIHAANYEGLMRRQQTKMLLETGAFETIVMLGSTEHPGSITELIRTGA